MALRAPMWLRYLAEDFSLLIAGGAICCTETPM